MISATVKAATIKKTPPNLVVPIQNSTYSLHETSDLLGHLPLPAYVQLTRRPLTSISSVTTGAVCPRSVLKTFILFVAEYDNTPKENGTA